MNTLKFIKRYLPTTEQHDLSLSSVKKINLFGNNNRLYQPCNLNISITNLCKNNCWFCLLRNKHASDISDEEYFTSLKKLFNEIKDKGYFEITLTGGEPTLNPLRLVETMRLCNEYGFPFRTFSTTGVGFQTIYNNIPLYEHLILNKCVNNINLSRMSCCDADNDIVMGSENITNDFIRRISKFFKLNDASFRLSCNLINGYIDSIDKIKSFITFYDNFGIDSFLFRELVSVNCNHPRTDDIIKTFYDIDFITSKSSMFYDVNIYTWRDFIVKHYQSTLKDSSVISSLYLNNGVIKSDFSGKLFMENLL